MEPGVTLFNPRRRRVGRGQEIADYNAPFGMPMALDAVGDVVWYHRTDSRISDFEKLGNGNLAFLTADSRLLEIDWLGSTVRSWHASRRPEGPAEGVPVDAQTFHHEIDELPNGNIVVPGTEWKEIEVRGRPRDGPDRPRVDAVRGGADRSAREVTVAPRGRGGNLTFGMQRSQSRER